MTYIDGKVQGVPALGSVRRNGQPGLLTPSFLPFTSSGVTMASFANFMFLNRFVPSEDMLLTKLSFITTLAATANDNCDVGIYSASGARLSSNGGLAGKLNATAGVQTVPLAATVLVKAGVPYYAAFAQGAIGGTACSMLLSAMGSSFIPQVFGNSAGIQDVAFKGSSYPLPSPASPNWSAASTSQTPLLWVRTD